MHTSGGRERAGWPDVSEILDTCGDRSRLPDFHARVHSFVCYVRCRKEICVHVERAGWPDFRARVYIQFGRQGKKRTCFGRCGEGWRARLFHASAHILPYIHFYKFLWLSSILCGSGEKEIVWTVCWNVY